MSDLNIYGVGASQYSSDYIGFTFNGVHSDTLGIKRTSEGSRFNENLLPTIQDKTVQVPRVSEWTPLKLKPMQSEL